MLEQHRAPRQWAVLLYKVVPVGADKYTSVSVVNRQAGRKGSVSGEQDEGVEACSYNLGRVGSS